VIVMTTTGGAGAAPHARTFPAGFLWGAATSAYQIEGAASEDGRGRSVWDTFSHTPGKVRGGDTGDVACDFYHRWSEDLDIAAKLGLGAFRFSIAWSRIQPEGRGAVNQRGIDFYRALVEGLHSRGITPAITLHHWDLPQALEDEGGWARRDTAARFGEYAQIVAEAIADGDALWITLNEPQQIVHQGYRVGTHAPGHVDDDLAAASTHHLLLAHGLAIQALRATLAPATRIGITLDLHPVRAIGADAREAAAIVDAEKNRIFFDPVIHGRYPQAARALLLPPAELIADGDMELIGAPLDFLGVNYYSPHYVKAPAEGSAGEGSPIAGAPGAVDFEPPELPRTAMQWLIEPRGLLDTLVAVDDETPPGLALYVTENGCAAEDHVSPYGEVEDAERVEYLRSHLEAAHEAIEHGVPLRGYFVWSLLDNFEWAWGYEKRFGIVFVDYDTQRRVLKRSAGFYGQVATSNSLPAETQAAT
jgi:beta-glucosidase